MTEAPRPHHHGNLRSALIEAAFAIMAEGGDLTLRAVAARAGVSHAAPAHHFSGLPGLRTAVAARAFEIFGDGMIRARNVAADTPAARLLAICHGYLDFAREHGAMFRLMFANCDLLPDDAALNAASDRAYGILVEACAPFAHSTQDALRLQTTVWTMVHGYAVLGMASETESPVQPPTFADLLGFVLPPQS